jgi:hypothetical protein
LNTHSILVLLLLLLLLPLLLLLLSGWCAWTVEPTAAGMSCSSSCQASTPA